MNRHYLIKWLKIELNSLCDNMNTNFGTTLYCCKCICEWLYEIVPKLTLSVQMQQWHYRQNERATFGTISWSPSRIYKHQAARWAFLESAEIDWVSHFHYCHQSSRQKGKHVIFKNGVTFLECPQKDKKFSILPGQYWKKNWLLNLPAMLTIAKNTAVCMIEVGWSEVGWHDLIIINQSFFKITG